MIDLDKIMDKKYQFKLNGELVNVNQPSVKMIRSFNSLMARAGEEEVDIFTANVEFATDILNNNTSAKKFKQSEIEKLPQKVVSSIIDVVANGIAEAEADPN